MEINGLAGSSITVPTVPLGSGLANGEVRITMEMMSHNEDGFSMIMHVGTTVVFLSKK